MNPVISQLRTKRDALKAEAEAISAVGETENRSLNTDELDAFEAKTAELAEVSARLAKLEQRELDLAAANAISAKVDAINGVEVRNSVRVGKEALTYTADYNGPSFFRDFMAAQTGNGFDGATDRLARHAVEMRDTTTSAYGSGIVVPQYLVDEFAPIVRDSRPFADSVRSLPLTAKGMTIDIPVASQGTTVGSQATQNTAVSEQDVAATTIQIPVITIAGGQEISFQALDRGYNVDGLTYADLLAAHAAELDRQTLSGDGTNNTLEGLFYADNVNTFSGAGINTFGEFYGKVWEAYSEVHQGRKLAPTHIVVTPRRWAWIQAQRDNDGRPFYAVNPVNAPGGSRFKIGDLDVVVDGNLEAQATPTDDWAVYRAADIILMESSRVPTQVRLDQPKGFNLTTQLVVYSYAAFTAERYPEAICTVTGGDYPAFS